MSWLGHCPYEPVSAANVPTTNLSHIHVMHVLGICVCMQHCLRDQRILVEIHCYAAAAA